MNAAPPPSDDPGRDIYFRVADADDAETIAGIVADSSDGLVDALLKNILPGLSPRAALSMAFANAGGAAGYANVVIGEKDGKPAGLLHAYPADQHVISDMAQTYVPKKRLARVAGILTATVPGTLHISTLWADEALGGPWMEAKLFDLAETWAKRLGLEGVTHYIWADDRYALAFLEARGYGLVRRLPASVPPINGRNGPHGDGGLLLTKRLAVSPAGGKP